MGYNIGVRMIEDFLAKSATTSCANFRETAEMISKVSSYKITGGRERCHSHCSIHFCRAMWMSSNGRAEVTPAWVDDGIHHW